MKSKAFAAILIVAVLISAGLLLLRPKGGAKAEIWLDGELLEVIDLDSLTEPIEIPVGDGNIVQAEKGRVRMLSADCPDRLCVHMGWSDSPARPIVCLPNRVTVVITGTDGERDAVIG